MKNFIAITDFGDEWKNYDNFSVSSVGHYLFCARVTYQSPKYGNQRENCTVHIFRNGMQDGEIVIYSQGVLQNETHHPGFSPKWQSYEFSAGEGALVVYGDSSKMKGKYSVRIVPNGREPSFR